MARTFTPSEKKHMLAFRKATGKPLVGKYSEKQLPEYNVWAEANGLPTINSKPSTPDDEDAAEQETGSGTNSGEEENPEQQLDQVSNKPTQIQSLNKKRKRGRPPKSSGHPSRTIKSIPKQHRVDQESLDELERRIELEEKLAAARAKRGEAELKIAEAAEKAAAAKMIEARAKVIAACAAGEQVTQVRQDHSARPEGADEEDSQLF